MQGKVRKTRVLPIVLATVLALSVSTNAFPLMGYAAETSTPVSSEEEIIEVIEVPTADLGAEESEEEEPAEEPEEKPEEEPANEETAEEIPAEEVSAEEASAEESLIEAELPAAEPDTDAPAEESSTEKSAEESAATEESVAKPVTAEESRAVEAEASTEPKAAGLSSDEASGSSSSGHHLAFASDYHGTEGSIQNAFTGMPDDVEYVSLIGDMVGDRGNMQPAYDSAMILDQVREIFPELDNTNVSIIWGSHDKNVNDEGTGIVKVMGGTGSEPIYKGTNEDSSPAYYIYAIAHYDMSNGDGESTEAAAGFKTWVDGINHTIPVIVLCHVPIQASRGDNKGASYWNEALNYAATGREGITTTDQTADIIRNVLFLHGHNHTNDRAEHYFGAGTEMDVQVDNSSEQSTYEPVPGERPPFGPGGRAEGVLSNIYYTSLTAGYLKTSGNATLVTVQDGALILTKYNGGQTVSLGTNGDTDDSMGDSFTIPAQRHIEGAGVEENVMMATCDHNGDYDLVVYCTVCSEELYRTHVTTEAAGHKWGGWTLTREATVEAEGEESRVCSVCGKTENRAVSRLNPGSFVDPGTSDQKEDTDEQETPAESGKESEQKSDEDQKEKAADTRTETEKKSGENGTEGPAYSAVAATLSVGSPLTGDESSPMLWLGLVALSLVALTAAVRWKNSAE